MGWGERVRQVLRRRGRHGDAEEPRTPGEDGSPVRETTPVALARRAEAIGDLDEARRQYLVALEQHDDDPETVLALARLAERCGAPDEARQWYGRARRSGLATARVAQAWVQAELRFDDVERARAVLADTADDLLDDADHRLLAAAIAVRSGEHAAALALVEPDEVPPPRRDLAPRDLLRALASEQRYAPGDLLRALLADRLTVPAAGVLARDPLLFDPGDPALDQLLPAVEKSRDHDEEGARIQYRFAIEEPGGSATAVGIARYCLALATFLVDPHEARAQIAALLASPLPDLVALGRHLQRDVGRPMDYLFPD